MSVKREVSEENRKCEKCAYKKCHEDSREAF